MLLAYLNFFSNQNINYRNSSNPLQKSSKFGQRVPPKRNTAKCSVFFITFTKNQYSNYENKKMLLITLCCMGSWFYMFNVSYFH